MLGFSFVARRLETEGKQRAGEESPFVQFALISPFLRSSVGFFIYSDHLLLARVCHLSCDCAVNILIPNQSKELSIMGEFTIQITNDLVNQLVDDAAPKKKTKRIRRKVARETQKPQSNVIGNESAVTQGWPVKSPLFLPGPVPVQPAHSELEGIQSMLRESVMVLERLQKQEENMLQEVTEKAKVLHDKEYKLPNPKPEPCVAERFATLACYKEHIKDPLKCASLVTSFADCLRRFGRFGDK
ncbi:hypothetical protein RJT34_33138 [Clitoria ternatea]|uniref:Uncharacterized protein n=1 Tax=Clitoria ternatea TaxID=43366 RepID=A0AAN9F5A5_CLITE